MVSTASIRSRTKRKVNSGTLGTGTLLDYLLPADAEGKPAIEIGFSLSPTTIAYTSLGIMSALIISGVVVNKLSK